MRAGLGEPLVQLPTETIEELRAFLDGQSRVQVAAWARHEEPGNEGLPPDHHLLLGVSDDDWATGDLRALEDAIPLPFIGMVGPTWQDFFPVSELSEIREYATLLWEQTTPGGDPLDYRYTYEPFQPEPVATERFATLLADEPSIRRVAAALEKLWNGDALVEERVQLYVGGRPLETVMDAAKTTILADRAAYGATLGRACDEAATVYEAA